MANTLMTLLVKLGLDSSDFEKGIDGAEKITRQGLSKISDNLGKVGDALTVGLTLPLAAAGASAVKLASDLEETTSKTAQIFGDMSKDITDWAETANTTMGQTRREALDAASTFALFGKAAGKSGKQLNEFAKQNVQFAADFASFYNTSPQDAIEAIGAAYRGESEPIRRYNILLNDQIIKQKALEMGLYSGNGELSQQARIMAVNAAITEQGGVALGDFARTSGGLANQTRILNAQFQDSLALLGKNLLPVVTKLVTELNTMLTSFQALSPGMQQAIVGFAIFFAALGPVLKGLQLLTNAIMFFSAGGAGAGAITWLTTALSSLAAAAGPVFAGAAAVFGGSIALMIGSVLAVGIAIAALIIQIQLFGPYALETLQLIWQIIVISVQKWLEELQTQFAKVFQKIRQRVYEFFAPVRTLAQYIGNYLVVAFRWLATAVGWVIQRINELKSAFANLKIPDWLTPGSPTPLEMGIRGINDAMKSATAQAMPQFTAGLQFSAAGALGGNGSGQTTININIGEQTVSTSRAAVRNNGAEILNALNAALGGA